MKVEAGPSISYPRGSDVLVRVATRKGLGESKHEIAAPEVTLQTGGGRIVFSLLKKEKKNNTTTKKNTCSHTYLH